MGGAPFCCKIFLTYLRKCKYPIRTQIQNTFGERLLTIWDLKLHYSSYIIQNHITIKIVEVRVLILVTHQCAVCGKLKSFSLKKKESSINMSCLTFSEISPWTLFGNLTDTLLNFSIFVFLLSFFVFSCQIQLSLVQEYKSSSSKTVNFEGLLFHFIIGA